MAQLILIPCALVAACFESSLGEPVSPWSFERIAQVCSTQYITCPVSNVSTHWPLVVREMRAVGQGSRASLACAIATIAIETASGFYPREELYNDPPGRDAYFESMYGVGRHRDAVAMGNTQPGDGARYPGRGLIQITWKNNYLRYGGLIGVDLVANPELALKPDNAAKIFALYWRDRDIQSAADRGNWASVREKVQGGSAGLDRLVSIVGSLL